MNGHIHNYFSCVVNLEIYFKCKIYQLQCSYLEIVINVRWLELLHGILICWYLVPTHRFKTKFWHCRNLSKFRWSYPDLDEIIVKFKVNNLLTFINFKVFFSCYSESTKAALVYAT